jgi:SpoVK/Ycf46/Vps4 family AAA+-type ATPase
MLAEAERIVVLLDEFDEMVRERQQANEVLSRFLTTSMLPKLAEISRRRRIVFIVATNYIDHFDVAIRRPGRFDMLLQVMPPTAYEKVSRSNPKVLAVLKELGVEVAAGKKQLQESELARKIGISDKIEALTYDEYRDLARDLEDAQGQADALAMIEETFTTSTLQSSYGDGETWSDACKSQRSRMRVPKLRRLGPHVQLVLAETGGNGAKNVVPAKSSRRPKQP